MIGAIHRRPDQIVHRGIQDQKIAIFARLHENHFGNQKARIARNQAPRLDLDFAAKIANRALDDVAIIHWQRRRGVRPLVGNAKPAAQIQPPDVVPVLTQDAGQFGNFGIGQREGFQIDKLRADVNVDPDHVQTGQFRRPRHKPRGRG